MLIGSCVATALVLGSLATACADEGSGKSNGKPATTSSTTRSAVMSSAMRMTREAPVGHRQPRAIDVPLVGQTPAEAIQLQQDREIDRKLLICRGC